MRSLERGEAQIFVDRSGPAYVRKRRGCRRGGSPVHLCAEDLLAAGCASLEGSGRPIYEPELMRAAMLEQHPMTWMVMVDGLIVDARTLPPEVPDEARQRGLIPRPRRAARGMTTPAELDALIEELTVDAYGDDEQLSGFLAGAQEAWFPESLGRSSASE